MSPQAPHAPIIGRARTLPVEPVRGSSTLTKKTFFSNFAGGHLVGASIAFHPAGEGCDLHNHRGAVELFTVIDGVGIIEVGGTPYEVTAQDTVLVPVGVNHKLTGISTDVPFTVSCVFVVAPGHEGDTQPWRPTE